MSEQPATPNPDAIELAPGGNEAFSQLMDVLAPEPDGAEGGTGAPAVGAEAPASDAPGGGSDAPAGSPAGGDAGTGGAAGTPGLPVAGEPGAGGAAAPGGDGAADGAAAGDAAGAGGGARPDAWTATAESFVPKLGQLSTALEENTQNAYRAEALAAVKEEHAQYFTALEKHPRLLVGTQVPRIDGKEGMETLKDTADAREWQEAVKQILVEEVTGRASVKLDENKDFLQTIHASIDLFKNNPDLIPGTKDFDVDLANRFATFAKPYELRVDGKLQGYSVPVQPMIDQLREQVVQARAAAPAAAPPAAGATSAGGASTPPPADPPQAGVPSKAGSGEQKEDFSTLFGTIGLPNIQI